MTARITSFRPGAPFVINLIALSIVLGGHAIAQSGGGVVKKGDIAAGAITARSLKSGTVTTKDLRRSVVTDAAIRGRAVVGRTLAPKSVVGMSLAGVNPYPASIRDLDPVGDAGDFTWTSSGATVSCPSGAKLFGGGLSIQFAGNGRGFVQTTAPSASDAATWVGAISTDTGGTSPGALVAICLKK